MFEYFTNGISIISSAEIGVLALAILATFIIILLFIAIVATFIGVIMQDYYKGYAKFAIILTFLYLPYTMILYWIFAKPANWDTNKKFEEDSCDW